MRTHNVSAIIDLWSDAEPLMPLTEHRPVGALPFGCRYRIIDFLLSSVSHAEIDSVAVFIKESGRSIYDHVRSGAEWNLDSSIRGGLFTFSQQSFKHLDYVHNNKDYDYYHNHREFLAKSGNEYVIVMGGGIVQTIDIEAVLKHHLARKADVTAVYKERLNAKTILELDENEFVSGYVDNDDMDSLKPYPTSVYLLKIATLNDMFDKAMEEGYYSDMTHVILKYMFNYKVSAFEYTGYIAVIDSIDSFFKQNMALLEPENFKSLFQGSVPVITRSRSGPPTYYSKTSNVRNAQLATGTTIEGTVENAIIFRKVNIGEGSTVKNAILMPGCKVGKDVTLEYVILDKGCVIEDGATVIGTPDNIKVLKSRTHVVKGD